MRPTLHHFIYFYHYISLTTSSHLFIHCPCTHVELSNLPRGACAIPASGTQTSKTPMGPLTNFNKVSFQEDVFSLQIAVKDSPESERSKQEVLSTPRPPLVYRNSSSTWAVPLGNHSSFTTICCQSMTAYCSSRSSKPVRCDGTNTTRSATQLQVPRGTVRTLKSRVVQKRKTLLCPREMIETVVYCAVMSQRTLKYV